MAVIPVGLVPGLNPLGIDDFLGVTFPQSGGRIKKIDLFESIIAKKRRYLKGNKFPTGACPMSKARGLRPRSFGQSKYHNLGMVAQELREYEEARRYYQLALEIKIEFGDRYESAKTYHALGLLAEAQEDYVEAKANVLKALEIYVEYNDEYWAEVARKVLERLP